VNYQEAKEFKNRNVEVYKTLKNAVSSLIQNKKLIIDIARVKELNISESYHMIFEEYGDDTTFDIKRKERLIGLILIDLLEESMNRGLSIDLVKAFYEIDEYLILIRQPRPTSNWYRHLDKEIIESVLLKLNFDKDVDILSPLSVISNDEERDKYRERGVHLYRYESYLFGILNELDLTISEKYQQISIYSNDQRYNRYAKEAIEDICIDNEKGIQLYQYGKKNESENVQSFNITCLIEIGKSNLDYAYNEANALLKNRKEDCIIPLMFFKYDTADRLRQSFDTVINNDFELKEKVRFFCKALENDVITKDLVDTSFKEMLTLFELEAPDLHHHTLWWIGMVTGHDDKKNEVLETIFQKNISFDPNEFFGKYENKKHIFDHLKDNYSHYNGAISSLNRILQRINNEEQELFDDEVINMLSSKKIHEANLAIEIIKSKYYGIYDLPYLNLNEENQLVAFERITTAPFIFEDLFPSLSKFSETKYESVIEAFKEKCVGYVDAYGSEFIEYFDRYIDKGKYATFLAELKEHNNTLKSHYMLKKAIKEFDPYINYYQPFKRYVENDNRRMALMQEHIRKKQSDPFGLFKNISVIRGSAFKSEQSDKIMRMGKFSSSKLLDKRIYEDPIKYEENYDKLFNSEQ